MGFIFGRRPSSVGRQFHLISEATTQKEKEKKTKNKLHLQSQPTDSCGGRGRRPQPERRLVPRRRHRRWQHLSDDQREGTNIVGPSIVGLGQIDATADRSIRFHANRLKGRRKKKRKAEEDDNQSNQTLLRRAEAVPLKISKTDPLRRAVGFVFTLIHVRQSTRSPSIGRRPRWQLDRTPSRLLTHRPLCGFH